MKKSIRNQLKITFVHVSIVFSLLMITHNARGQVVDVITADNIVQDVYASTPQTHFAPPEVEENYRAALNRIISIDLENVPMEKALKYITDQGGLRIAYSKSTNNVRWNKPVTLAHDEITLLGALYAVLEDTDLRLMLSSNSRDGQLVITKGNVQEAENQSALFPLQERVTGTVTDASTNEPIPGVNVAVEGTSTGTVTDADGSFSLNVPSLNETLVVSYIGYHTQEINLNGRTDLEITLQSEVVEGEEMVVTAFGIAREARSRTFSTQGVETDQLTEARELNVMSSLQGKVAGISINQSGSGVGAPTRVVLRGNRSISGSSQPLYVIDGVPTRGSLEDLSPDNIASIDVLKGPNAAALYGSEAQNGVIIVETLQGEAGDVQVSLNNNFMLGQPIHYMEVQNQYGQGLSGNFDPTSGESWGPRMEGQPVTHWSLDPDDPEEYPMTPQPDNFKDIFQTAYNVANNMTVTVGGENAQTVLSYTRTDARGIMPNNNLGKNNLLVRLNNRLSNKFSLDLKVDYLNQRTDNPISLGENQTNPHRLTYTMPRSIQHGHLKNYEYTDESGKVKQNSWAPGQAYEKNPYWQLNNQLTTVDRERLMLMASLTYDISENLSLSFRGSYDGEDNTREGKHQEDSFGSIYHFGYYSLNKSSFQELNSDVLLSYDEDISEDWSVNAHVGGSIKRRGGGGSLGADTRDELLVPNFFSMSNTQFPNASYSLQSNSETQSVFASGQIGWRDGIYLDVTGRNDWSSTLPVESQSYFYPSVGLTAVISDLIEEFPSFFSFTSLRASYAQVGSSASPYMLSRSARFYSGGDNGFLQLGGILPNENLLPEQTESYEVGLDMRLFGGRLGLDLTAYKTNTTNQLFTIELPTGSGADAFYTNGGDVENQGIEAILSGTPVQQLNFMWDVELNFSTNRNMVNSISDERPRVVVGGDSYMRDFVVEQGEEFGNIYSRGWIRDDQGRVIVSENGIPTFTSGREVKVANFNPDWQGSFSNMFSFGNITASFLIEHRQGGTMVSTTNSILAGRGVLKMTEKGRDGGLVFGEDIFSDETAVLEDGSPNNIEVNAQEFWRSVGGRNTPVGEAFVQDATNTRLREVRVGYLLPQSVLSNLPFSNVKLSFVARNLFFLYREADWDPDILTGTTTAAEGFQSFAPPSQRTFGANLNIDF